MDLYLASLQFLISKRSEMIRSMLFLVNFLDQIFIKVSLKFKSSFVKLKNIKVQDTFVQVLKM